MDGSFDDWVTAGCPADIDPSAFEPTEGCGMTCADIERLLHHWPTVVSHARDDWASGFAKSILKQSRRRNWRPSPKQLQIMRRMVSELFITGTEQEEDIILIE